MSPRVSILNCEFDALTLPQTVDAVFQRVSNNHRGWLATVNVTTLMAMIDNPALQSFVHRACIVVADGQPLVWCAPLFGGDLPERVTGIDLVEALCKRAAETGVGIFLLGSTGRLLERALARLRRRYPELRIGGLDGHYPAASAEERVAAINASQARILLVGMGSPRQERFVETHWERLQVDVAIGVGGSLDVIAGARVRAPRWVGRMGLEWLVRLVQEPRRLFLRYLAANTRFCGLIFREVYTWLRRSRR